MHTHLRHVEHEHGVELLGERNVVGRAERHGAQLGEADARHAARRRGERQPAARADGGRDRPRAAARELLEARLGRGGRGVVQGREVHGHVGRVQLRAVVEALAGRVARAQVDRLAALEDALREARLRVLAVHPRRGELGGRAVARGHEDPAGVKEPVEHARHDGRVGNVHHLHLVEAEHAARDRLALGVLDERGGRRGGGRGGRGGRRAPLLGRLLGARRAPDVVRDRVERRLQVGPCSGRHTPE